MIETGEAFDIIYTDFAKAFDSVAHVRLLHKLESIGIKGDLLNWVKSFLLRTQCVNVDGITSKMEGSGQRHSPGFHTRSVTICYFYKRYARRGEV